MSENTVARPYSKAIFEHALASAKLAEWSNILQRLAQIVTTAEVMEFIDNPSTISEQQVELLLSATPTSSDAKENAAVKNIVALLADNKRLMVLPEIAEMYEALKAEQEKTIEAKVVSYAALTPEQQEKLAQSLSQRLQCKVSIEVSVDPAILGGAKISAGDLVIDGSVRGQLNKLATLLA